MNKKILIIGEKGFIASKLYRYLKKKKNKINHIRNLDFYLTNIINHFIK